MTVALQGDAGKPRPAVIIETDRLAPTLSVIICPGTGTIRPEVDQRRVLVQPSPANGLKIATQFQADKITFIRRERCGRVVGQLEQEPLDDLSALLFVILGFADRA